MNTALIIFIKNPIRGKVKTRLAETLGADKAFEIYTELIRHTNTIASGTNCDKFLFYSDSVEANDEWDNTQFKKHSQYQADTDLGKRMFEAFKLVFEQGYKKAVIIGGDCPELSSEHIEQAFSLLDNNNCVLGPANDGGYYLLGMNSLYPNFFTHKKWGTDSVIQDTINDIKTQGLTYYLLEELIDVDTEADYLQVKAKAVR